MSNTLTNSQNVSTSCGRGDDIISIHDIAKDAFGGPEREREAIQSHALDLIEKSARKELGLDVYGGGKK